MLDFILYALLFFIGVGVFYIIYLDVLQVREAKRLGVPVIWGIKYWRIDVAGHRCSEELRTAYRRTGWLKLAIFAAVIVSVFLLKLR